MHNVAFLFDVKESQVDSAMEIFLEDYDGEETYYCYEPDYAEYDSYDEMLKAHPDVADNPDSYYKVNPYAWCDYYTVGGRWDGYFLTKDGKRVNSVKIGDIDFDGMIAEAKQIALKRYRTALEAIKYDTNFKSLHQIQKEEGCFSRGKDECWRIAAEKYDAQRQVIEWREWRKQYDNKMEYFSFSLDIVLNPLEDYENDVIVNKLTPVATIVGDCWEELPTGIGPNGVKKGLEWLNEFRNMNKDRLVTMIDYHI